MARRLHSARQNGLVGGAQTIKGDASLRIDFQNMPRGTRVRSDASGMFKTIQINRGRAISFASEDG